MAPVTLAVMGADSRGSSCARFAAEHIDTTAADASILGGHDGGDSGLMDGFVRAVSNGDTATILSGPEEILETHLMVFAAERARHEQRVVDAEV